LFIIIKVHSCWFKSNLIKIYDFFLCFIILRGVFFSFLLCYYFTGKNRHFKRLITFRNATDEDGCYPISYLCLWYTRGIFFFTFTSAPKLTHTHTKLNVMQSRHKTKINLNPLRRDYRKGLFYICRIFKKNVISTICFYRY